MTEDVLAFTEGSEEHSDAAEVRSNPRVLGPAVVHQRDEVLVDVGIIVDVRSIDISVVLIAHLLKYLYNNRQRTRSHHGCI